MSRLSREWSPAFRNNNRDILYSLSGRQSVVFESVHPFLRRGLTVLARTYLSIFISVVPTHRPQIVAWNPLSINHSKYPPPWVSSRLP